MTLPHPTTMTLPREEIAARFVRVTHDSMPDAGWHFEMALPKSAQMSTRPGAVPAADGQLVSLGCFHLPEPAADLEIYGAQLNAELDPADFLDLWLEKTGMKTLSKFRLVMLGGAVGDAVVTWPEDGAFAGRCYCLKFGPRLVLLWCRCAKGDYAGLAETFFLAMSTLHLKQDQGLLAQRVNWAISDSPVPWKLALPLNWTISPQVGHGGLASFEAVWVHEGGAIQGKISLAVVAPNLAEGMEDAFGRAEAAAKAAGLELGPPTTLQEQPTAGFLAAASRTAAGTLSQQPVEFRYRVLQHPKLWLIAGVISPARAVAPAVWMHAKRALDIGTGTLEVT